MECRKYSGIALVLRYMTGSENSRHFLDQSDSKLTPIATWSPSFSRDSGSLVVFTLSSHWLRVIIP